MAQQPGYVRYRWGGPGAGAPQKGQPQPAAAAAAGAAGAGVTPAPVDPAFEQAKLSAGRNVAVANSEASYQQGNLGFDLGYNPDGTVNTANPYSRAALLQLGHENQARGNTNNFAAKGQLYSGSLTNAQGINDQNYAQNEAANRLAYQRGLHGIQSGQLSTYANNALGVGDSDFQSLLKATYPGS